MSQHQMLEAQRVSAAARMCASFLSLEACIHLLPVRYAWSPRPPDQVLRPICMVVSELRAQLPWSIVGIQSSRRYAFATSTGEADQAPFLLSSPRAHGLGGRSHDYGSHEGIAIFSCAGIRLSTRAQRGRRGRQSAKIRLDLQHAYSRHMHV
jgi:hypothetical protein